MLNRVILIGRLTKDPELRYTPSGVATASFTLACDRQYTSGDKKETDFIPIVTWRQLAETVANHLKKGRLCAIEGRIEVSNYENNEGKRVYTTKVIADNVRFLDTNKDGTQSAAKPDTNRDPFKDDGKPIDISSDDLPF